MINKQINKQKFENDRKQINWFWCSTKIIEQTFGFFTSILSTLHSDKVLIKTIQNDTSLTNSLMITLSPSKHEFDRVTLTYEFSYITKNVKTTISKGVKNKTGKIITIHEHMHPDEFTEKSTKKDFKLFLLYSRNFWHVDFGYKFTIYDLFSLDIALTGITKRKKSLTFTDYLFKQLSSKSGYTALFKGGIAITTLYLVALPQLTNIMLPIEKDVVSFVSEKRQESKNENLKIDDIKCKIEDRDYPKCQTAKHQHHIENTISSASKDFGKLMYYLCILLYGSSIFGFIINPAFHKKSAEE